MSDRIDPDVGEAGGAQDLVDVVLLAERERPGRARRPRLGRPEPLDADLERQREPGIVLERRPADERQAAARAQRARQVAKGADRIAEEHHAEARHHEVVACALEPVGLGIRLERGARWRGRACMTRRRATASSGSEMSIARTDPCAPTARGELQGGGAGAAADVDHAFAGADPRPGDQRLGQRREALIERLLAGDPPASRLRVPVLGLIGVRERVRGRFAAHRSIGPLVGTDAHAACAVRASQASRSASARRAMAGLRSAFLMPPIERREQAEIDVHRLEGRGVGAARDVREQRAQRGGGGRAPPQARPWPRPPRSGPRACRSRRFRHSPRPR